MLVLIPFLGGGRGKGLGAYLSLSGSGREVGWGWALIQAWALIKFFCLQDGRLFKVGANSRLGAYSNKYGNLFQFAPSCLYPMQHTIRLSQQISAGSFIQYNKVNFTSILKG